MFTLLSGKTKILSWWQKRGQDKQERMSKLTVTSSGEEIIDILENFKIVVMRDYKNNEYNAHLCQHRINPARYGEYMTRSLFDGGATPPVRDYEDILTGEIIDGYNPYISTELDVRIVFPYKYLQERNMHLTKEDASLKLQLSGNALQQRGYVRQFKSRN